MPSLMAVRCEQCGSENNPQYHFCGMCGAPLPRSVPPAAPAVTRPSAPVSGPSFLGLTDAPPRRDTSYLLEDEEEDSSRGPLIIIGILIVLAAAGCATWYVHTGKWPWQWAFATQTAGTQSDAPPAQPSVTNSPAPVPPQQGAAGIAAPTPPVTEDKQETAPAPAQTPAVAPTPITQTPTPNPPADNAETNGSSGAQTSGPALDDGTTEAAPAPAEPAPVKKAPVPKPPVAKPAQSQPGVNSSPEDKLALEGERYLYGNGVPQDCDRAQKDILTAAKKGSAKSYTLLGAMYATGHCVTKDLPTAYRWFARGLHQDPANTRLEQNLEVLWRQMTPPERQLATRAQ